MERSKRVIFISHCIINQNTVVCPLARAKGAYRDLGLKREPMDKNQYDTIEYRNLCKNISQDTINIMKEYLDNDYEIVGLIGINESPTCSIRGAKGILMEELLALAKKEKINLRTIDVPTNYMDGRDNEEFIKELEGLMKN